MNHPCLLNFVCEEGQGVASVVVSASNLAHPLSFEFRKMIGYYVESVPSRYSTSTSTVLVVYTD
jgi:hypothetical protein